MAGTIFWWCVIILLFLGGMAGLFYPVIPSILLIWGGFLIFHFFVDPLLPPSFWITMGILTLIILVADYFFNLYFVHKYGGSKFSQWAAIAAMVVGPFIMGPVGLVILPFIAVLMVELYMNRNIRQAAWAALGTFLGFISSTLIKFILQVFMIGWFIFLVV